MTYLHCFTLRTPHRAPTEQHVPYIHRVLLKGWFISKAQSQKILCLQKKRFSTSTDLFCGIGNLWSFETLILNVKEVTTQLGYIWAQYSEVSLRYLYCQLLLNSNGLYLQPSKSSQDPVVFWFGPNKCFSSEFCFLNHVYPECI